MIRYLGRDAVLRLNETHGYFQFRDAQGDVSRDFANDAVSAFISAAIESTLVLDETGKTPAELAASLADAQAEIARLRGALESAQRYAVEFPDSLLRDNLLDTVAEALK